MTRVSDLEAIESELTPFTYPNGNGFRWRFLMLIRKYVGEMQAKER